MMEQRCSLLLFNRLSRSCFENTSLNKPNAPAPSRILLRVKNIAQIVCDICSQLRVLFQGHPTLLDSNTILYVLSVLIKPMRFSDDLCRIFYGHQSYCHKDHNKHRDYSRRNEHNVYHHHNSSSGAQMCPLSWDFYFECQSSASHASLSTLPIGKSRTTDCVFHEFSQIQNKFLEI